MKKNGCELIGASRAILELKSEIGRIAQSDAKVLITGESGVGKELVARAIHGHGQRADRPFMPMNCAGLPETLLESELFGHVKGSFTGAYRDKPGKLEIADGGTVFLDEVGEMSLRMQGLLLRFLETGELQKVGAERFGKPTNVRVLAATNRHLDKLITAGQFREDLFYRLKVIHLHVRPLRERKEDIPILVQQFLQRLTEVNGYRVRSLAPEAMARLAEYDWPGNVRELENIIECLVVTVQREVVQLTDLPPEIRLPRSTSVLTAGQERHAPVEELYQRLVERRESFWAVVYPLYMQREITRTDVRTIVRRGLKEARGNYRIVTNLFNIEQADYKRFLNFLRKHDCQLPFKDYR